MTKNPFLNAIGASVYIALVILLLNFSSTIENSSNLFLVQLIMLSLLVLSVTVMAYVFGYQPIRMFLNGKKEEAVKLFLQTVGVFAGITLIILTLFLTGVVK